jgi:hypothetical protein
MMLEHLAGGRLHANRVRDGEFIEQFCKRRDGRRRKPDLVLSVERRDEANVHGVFLASELMGGARKDASGVPYVAPVTPECRRDADERRRTLTFVYPIPPGSETIS